jgi:hypothetical protein
MLSNGKGIPGGKALRMSNGKSLHNRNLFRMNDDISVLSDDFSTENSYKRLKVSKEVYKEYQHLLEKKEIIDYEIKQKELAIRVDKIKIESKILDCKQKRNENQKLTSSIEKFVSRHNLELPREITSFTTGSNLIDSNKEAFLSDFMYDNSIFSAYQTIDETMANIIFSQKFVFLPQKKNIFSMLHFFFCKAKLFYTETGFIREEADMKEVFISQCALTSFSNKDGHKNSVILEDVDLEDLEEVIIAKTNSLLFNIRSILYNFLENYVYEADLSEEGLCKSVLQTLSEEEKVEKLGVTKALSMKKKREKLRKLRTNFSYNKLTQNTNLLTSEEEETVKILNERMTSGFYHGKKSWKNTVHENQILQPFHNKHRLQTRLLRYFYMFLLKVKSVELEIYKSRQEMKTLTFNGFEFPIIKDSGIGSGRKMKDDKILTYILQLYGLDVLTKTYIDAEPLTDSQFVTILGENYTYDETLALNSNNVPEMIQPLWLLGIDCKDKRIKHEIELEE